MEIAPNEALVSGRGNYSRVSYTLGSPRRGLLYESTAVPELRQQAQQLAKFLLGELQPSVPRREVATFEI